MTASFSPRVFSSSSRLRVYILSRLLILSFILLSLFSTCSRAAPSLLFSYSCIYSFWVRSRLDENVWSSCPLERTWVGRGLLFGGGSGCAHTRFCRPRARVRGACFGIFSQRTLLSFKLLLYKVGNEIKESSK